MAACARVRYCRTRRWVLFDVDDKKGLSPVSCRCRAVSLIICLIVGYKSRDGLEKRATKKANNLRGCGKSTEDRTGSVYPSAYCRIVEDLL